MQIYDYELLAKHVKGIIEGGQVIFGSLYEEDAHDDNLSRAIDIESVLFNMRQANVRDFKKAISDPLFKVYFERRAIEDLLDSWNDFGEKPELVH